MKVFRANQLVKVITQLVDDGGEPLTPVSITHRITDETGTELLAPTPLTFAPEDTEIEIAVPDTLNQLATGAQKNLRAIELALLNADGTMSYIQVTYLITARESLLLMVNSYQTLNEAKLLMLDMLDVDELAQASEPVAVAALTSAYERIGRLNFDVSTSPSFFTNQSVETGLFSRIGMGRGSFLNTLSPEVFATLPIEFRSAIKRAQICEANSLITNDPVQQKINSGIRLERVGESTYEFNPMKPLSLAVDRKTLAYLGGWVTFRIRLSRS